MLPVDALLCTSADCQLHQNDIETYYNEIISCLLRSSQECVPGIKVGLHQHCWTPRPK